MEQRIAFSICTVLVLLMETGSVKPDCHFTGVICNSDHSFQLCVPSGPSTWSELPGGRCPTGTVCNCRSSRICTTPTSFRCSSVGLFADPEPCSPVFHMCIQDGLHNFRLLDGACPPGFVFDATASGCVSRSACSRFIEHKVESHEFHCRVSGRFPSSHCSTFHVCCRRGARLVHHERTCRVGFEFSADIRRCVPQWKSRCHDSVDNHGYDFIRFSTFEHVHEQVRGATYYA